MNPWVLPLLVLTGVGLTQAFASTSYGIELDQSCLTMLRNNITTDCPSYEEINTLFPDTSNKKIIGDFEYKNGLYQRVPSKYSNPSGYYRFGNDNIIFIDPPYALFKSINRITIRANLDEFKLPGTETYNNEDYSLTLGQGRFMRGCTQAYIDASNWLFLLGDTLQYMKNNCDPAFTNFNSTKTTYLTKITHDISTSYKYKLDKWFKQSIEECGHKICFYGNNQTAPP